jgi:hypothetical protein
MQQRWTSHGENKGKASWGSATAFLFWPETSSAWLC